MCQFREREREVSGGGRKRGRDVCVRLSFCLERAHQSMKTFL